MNGFRRIFCVIAALGLLLILAVPAAKGDGIPLTKIELQGTLRENRQLAYVTVDGGGEYETLELFLSVVSLEPGNNLSIIIPLRTKPYSVWGLEKTERDFRNEHDFNSLQRLAAMQNECGKEVAEHFAESAKELAGLQALGLVYLYTMTIGMGGIDGPEYYDIADGVSMELISFNSTESLNEFYDSQGVPVPDKVKEIIDEYGNFNIGVINAVTRPPIDEAAFNTIAARYPRQLEEFREFVRGNPTIEVSEYWEYYPIDTPEILEILDGVNDHDIREDFVDLITATYGLGDTEGTLISFRLPLYNGEAFFPLGTTPAWHGVHKTEVIFEIQDYAVIDFNRKGNEVFTNDNHYYLWTFENESPDYDLEGKVKNAGFSTGINKFGRQTEQYIYENAASIGFSLSILMYLGLWCVGLWGFSRLRRWDVDGKKHILEICGLAAVCFFSSLVFTLFFALWMGVAGMLVFERKYSPAKMENFARSPPGTIRMPEILFGFVMSLTAVGSFYLIVLSLMFQDEGAAPLALGFIASMFVIAHYFYTRANPPPVRRQLVIWGAYVIMVLPGLYYFHWDAVCISILLILLLVQTLIYILMVKEREEHRRVRLEMEKDEIWKHWTD